MQLLASNLVSVYHAEMLYNVLGRLFRTDPFDARYIPKPLHLVYSLLLVAMGIKSASQYEWVLFGIFSTLIGILLGLTIILGMNWDKVIEYWSVVNENIRLMMKIKDPDIWMALGYKQIPQSVEVIEAEDKGQGFVTTRILNYGVPPARLNLIANKVIMTGKTNFTEADYSSLIPNFRRIQKLWIKDGYLVQRHKNNPRLGYTFSKKGMDMIYQFASDSVRLKGKNESQDIA